MIMVGVGSVRIDFYSIETVVFCHLQYVGVEVVLVAARSLRYRLKLLLDGCVCSEQLRLLPSSLHVM